MPRKIYKPEEIIAKLRQVEVLTSQGKTAIDAFRSIGMRPERANHVWAYDFIEDRTHDGRKTRMLDIVDEFTREALAIHVARRLNSNDVIDVLSNLFILRGVPGDALVADISPPHLRGASFGLRQSLDTVGAFLGPLLAIGLMWLTAAHFSAVFWIAVVPAFLLLGLIASLPEYYRSP